MTRRWVSFVGLVSAAVAYTIVATGPVGAGPAAEVGWWSQSPAASAPAGGFAVADAGNQQVSVAAVRVVLPRGDHKVVLSAPEAGGAGQALAAIRACTTTSTWKAASPGPWAEAPEAACGSYVVFQRAADGKSWRADVSSLVFGGGDVSIMLVPGPAVVPVDDSPVPPPVPLTQPPTPVPVSPTFEVQFGPPDVTVDLAPSVDEGGGGTTDTTLSPFEPDLGFEEELPTEQALPPSAFLPDNGPFEFAEPPTSVAPKVPADTVVEPLPRRIAATGRSGPTRTIADALLALALALVVGAVVGGGRWVATAGPRPAFLRHRAMG